MAPHPFEVAAMEKPTPASPAPLPPEAIPYALHGERPEEGMNEVLLGLAWMVAGKAIRKAQAAAAAR
jgi:hypothetical protein